jgi:DNA transformation protein
MDAAAIKDIFAAFAQVSVRKMFGGHGVYADGLCFAIEAFGEIYLKVDAETEPAFEAAGTKRFTYEMSGKPKSMAYRTMPGEAEDDEEALKRWCGLALAAARRADLAKQAKAVRGAARKRR